VEGNSAACLLGVAGSGKSTMMAALVMVRIKVQVKHSFKKLLSLVVFKY